MSMMSIFNALFISLSLAAFASEEDPSPGFMPSEIESAQILIIPLDAEKDEIDIITNSPRDKQIPDPVIALRQQVNPLKNREISPKPVPLEKEEEVDILTCSPRDKPIPVPVNVLSKEESRRKKRKTSPKPMPLKKEEEVDILTHSVQDKSTLAPVSVLRKEVNRRKKRKTSPKPMPLKSMEKKEIMTRSEQDKPIEPSAHLLSQEKTTQKKRVPSNLPQVIKKPLKKEPLFYELPLEERKHSLTFLMLNEQSIEDIARMLSLKKYKKKQIKALKDVQESLFPEEPVYVLINSLLSCIGDKK